MANIVNRASVLAMVQETTEGTPVAPSVGTDFIALQPDFDMSPQFEELTNEELRNSIGRGKSITGAENPSASGSFYLRGSGAEGSTQDILWAIFESGLGALSQVSEYDTVASSTTTVIKVDSGEGANYVRGIPLLIKDGTNGYAIRPVHSISGDNLTIGFAVGTAPGSGVNLGQGYVYRPTDTGHYSLSLWHFLGNSGATQLMAGSKITEFGLDFNAGQLIAGTYTAEGLEYFFNPITIASADRYLDFTDDAGTHAAVVTAKTYKDPHELAAALQTAMDEVTTTTPTVTYSDTTGKFTIKTSGTVLSLLWNTGGNTANTIGDKIGFSVAADDTGTAATTGYTSDNAISFAAPATPSYSTVDPLVAKSNELFIGDSDDNVCIDASTASFRVTNTRAVIGSICADSGRSGSIFNGREVTFTATALLDKFDADKFRRYRANSDTRILYNFGTKTGGNWDAGKSGCIYLPTASISEFDLSDQDGLVALTITAKAYVDADGNGEVYVGFV